jgi:hypothetical protein
MRQDQFERLQQLEERLIDVAIEEADPDKWPGKGVAVAAMDQQTRGDRYWVKKNAVATISLAQRVGVLMGSVQGFGTTPTAEEGDDQQQHDHLDAEVKAAEKEAQRLLKALQSGEGKAQFDKRVHGKSAG